MDEYTYLLISIFLFPVWAIIFIARKDLKEKIIKTSVLGGLAGLVSEFWYFKDYWQPPSLFGEGKISIEDFLFGFLITGIAATIYDAVFGKIDVDGEKKRRVPFGILFITGIVSLLVFNNWLGINSIFVSSFAFLIFSVIMVLIKKNLLIPSIASGLLCLIVIVPIYAIIFNAISPEYWDKHWLLAKTKLGITILGNIPATELLWFFSWGCLAGIGYNFSSGKRKAKREKSQNC